MTKRIIRDVTVRSDKLTKPLTLAFAPDLHNGPFDDVLDQLKTADAVLVGGDLVLRYTNEYDQALRFLETVPKFVPTFYTIGNHERKLESFDEYMSLVRNTDAVLLENRYVHFGGLVLGGLSSARAGEADDTVVREMAQQPGFRLLVCHHPEYYPRFVQPHDIDLTLSGHAHGGQVQLFGHGLYSPDQGFFPKLTHGFYDGGRLLVSRGMTNANNLPRWFNPCELIMLHLSPK